MNKQSFLERLLDGAEVKWLPLGNETVGEFVRGSNLQKKDFTAKGIGCIHCPKLWLKPPASSRKRLPVLEIASI